MGSTQAYFVLISYSLTVCVLQRRVISGSPPTDVSNVHGPSAENRFFISWLDSHVSSLYLQYLRLPDRRRVVYLRAVRSEEKKNKPRGEDQLCQWIQMLSIWSRFGCDKVSWQTLAICCFINPHRGAIFTFSGRRIQALDLRVCAIKHLEPSPANIRGACGCMDAAGTMISHHFPDLLHKMRRPPAAASLHRILLPVLQMGNV